MNIKIIRGFIGIAAITLLASTASANLLSNPGFEDPAFGGAELPGAGDGWTSFGNVFRVQQTGGGCDPISCAGAHGGTVALKAFGASGAYQDFAASEGDAFDGSVWAINPENADFLRDGGFALVQIIWLDAAGGVLGDVSDGIDEFTPLDTWTLLSVSGVAPMGTATARFQLFQDGGGAPRWDDASFTAAVVPVPGALLLMGSGLLGLLGFRRKNA